MRVWKEEIVQGINYEMFKFVRIGCHLGYFIFKTKKNIWFWERSCIEYPAVVYWVRRLMFKMNFRRKNHVS